MVLEGTDGGGKTSLAKELTDTYLKGCKEHDTAPKVLNIHKGQPVSVDAFREYENDLTRPGVFSLVTSPTGIVITDRWHVGETIYGPILRGMSRLSEIGVFHVELALTALGAIKVLVQPRELAVIQSRLRHRGDNVIKFEWVEDIHSKYEEHGSRYEYLHAEDLNLEAIIATASTTTSITRGPNSLPTVWPGYVGSAEPKYILVGDERNPGPRGDLTYPFAFTPWQKGGSAAYLMGALMLTGWHTWELGIGNINDKGVDPVAVTKAIPSHTAVIALGERASTTLKAAGIHHGKVPHPQWWRRFRNDDTQGYASLIKGTAGGNSH